MDRDAFFTSLWNQYIRVTPQANDIQILLTTRGERVVNDHVAFRTFDIKGYDLATVSNILASIGYKAFDSYNFPDKMLRANAYSVPGDSRAPKIFFSELIRSELDDESRSCLLYTSPSPRD